MSADLSARGAERSRAIPALALFALGLVLYARALGFEFVDWDDTAQVVENPWIRSLTLEHLRSIFSQPVLDSYFPLQSVSFMLDYAVWGLDPRGFHAQSLFWNALNGTLACWALARLTRRRDLALVAALLWSVHHSHVEAVAWVSARKEVLSTALLLLSLGWFVRAREAPRLDRRAYAASIVCFGLGAAAKLTIGSYALFFALSDWTLRGRRTAEREPLWRHVAVALPYVAAALPFVVMNYFVQPTVHDPGIASGFDALLVRGQAGWRYLWLLLGLLPGQPLYDPPMISHDPLLVAAILFPLLAPIAAFAFALRRGCTNVALALAWLMIGMLAPLVFPLTTFMADRYLYSPSLGFAWLLASGIAALAFAPSQPRAQNAAVALLLTVPLVFWYARLTWYATPTWRNSETLWARAVASSRDDRAWGALANALIRKDRRADAERVLLAAPSPSAGNYLQLASIYAQENRLDEALRATDQSLAVARIHPPPRRADLAQVHFVRGAVLWLLHRPADATEAWQAAIEIDPGQREARTALAAVERGEDPGAAIKPAR
jgi:hypothetical protein